MLHHDAVKSQSENLRFEHLTTNDGLSEGVVYQIIQDSKGYLWFGTHDGLNRYDGYSFKVFKYDPYDLLSLRSNVMLTIFEDSRSMLWIGTMNGLHQFNRETETFRWFSHQENDTTSLPGNGINSITEDRHGNLWIGTNRGLCTINSEELMNNRQPLIFSHIRNGFHEKESIHSYSVQSVYVDSSGTLWVGTDIGVYFLPEGGNKLQNIISDEHNVTTFFEEPRGIIWIASLNGLRKYYRTTNEHILISELRSIARKNDKGVRAILKTHDGTLWFATFIGLMRYNSQTDKWVRYTKDPRDSRTLNNNRLYSICLDKSGVLWIGTFGSGVNRVNLAQKKFYHYKHTGESVLEQHDNMVMSLLEDLYGKIWIGTWENHAVEFDRLTNRWLRHRTFNPLVNSIAEDAHRNIWFGTSSGIDKFDRRRNRIVSDTVEGVNKILVKDNVLWYGRRGSLFKRDLVTNHESSVMFDSTSSISPTSIQRDDMGEIWFAGRGLFRYNEETNRLKNYRHEPGNQQSISSDGIYSICIARDGTVWIGSSDAGLNRFNRYDESFTHYFEKDGLPNNVVYGILEDDDGSLWLSTNRGISRFNPNTGTFRNFDEEDGLQANEFNRGAYFKSKRGEMFFGGVNGFNSFFPKEILDNPHVPTIILTDFLVFNKTKDFPQAIDAVREIMLPYDENFFSFEFAALDFVNSKKNKYKYKLEGFDRDWVNAGMRRLATYTDVHPGDYVFRVIGSNNDDVWNEEGLVIAVKIVPPYWETWWFRFFAIVVLLSIGPLIYFRRVSKLEREKKVREDFSHQLIESQENERKRIAAELHDGLGQELLIIKNKALLGLQEETPVGKQTMLEDISTIVSETLGSVSDIAYSLRPYQLEYLGLTNSLNSLVKRASESSKIRFTNRIENIDGMLPQNQEIDFYRIVQECINNILKHSEASEVLIIIKKELGRLLLIVQDNGKGFDVETARKQRGFGLKGLDERVRILSGEIFINSQNSQGTSINITISLKG